MASLNIRRRGEAADAVLPQVRQVDYSGIGNNALTRHQASGGIGVDIQSAVKGIAHGISSTVEAWNARDEREAVEQAEKVRTDLVMDKAKFLRDLETGAIKFKTTKDVVDEWDSHVEKIKGKVAGNIGATDSYLRRCFDRATRNLFDNAAVEVFRAGNATLDKQNQTAATALLQNSLHDIVEADPDKRTTVAFDEALVQAQHAFRWTDEEMKVKRREYKEALGVACANRAIAEAATSTDLDKINEAIINIGVDKPTEAQRQGVQKVFGTIDASAITTEKRVAIQDAIRRKRANLVQVQSETVTGLEAQYLEGKIGINGLIDVRNKMYDKDGKPLADISTINRLDKLITTAQTKADNEAVESFMVNAVRTNPDDKTLDILVAALPATVRDSLRVANFVAQAKAGNAKEAYNAEQEARKIRLDQVVYNRGATQMSLSERQAELEAMFARGEITGDQWDSAQKKIKVQSDIRTREIAQSALQLLTHDGVWLKEHNFKFSDSGFNRESTLSGFLKGLEATSSAYAHGVMFVKTFDEYYTEWVRLVTSNPTWTEDECKESFLKVMDPVLKVYAEESIQLNTKKWNEVRDNLARIRSIAGVSEKRTGFDMSVSDLNKNPSEVNFSPVGGNRKKQ